MATTGRRATQRSSLSDVIAALDAPIQRLFARELTALGADEGSIWWFDRRHSALTIVLNSGPHQTALVGKVSQPMDKGLVSMVLATQQPFCENDVAVNRERDSTLDRMLGVRTEAMIAVPLVLDNIPAGVVSAVQLTPSAASSHPPFEPESMRLLQDVSVVLGRVLAHALSRSRP